MIVKKKKLLKAKTFFAFSLYYILVYTYGIFEVRILGFGLNLLKPNSAYTEL